MMKQITLLMMGLFMIAFNMTYAQIAEFEGTVRATAANSIFQLYDTSVKGDLFEFGNSINLRSWKGDLRFLTATTGSPANRMTIDGATGNVGIGTTDPNSKLEVEGDVRISDATAALNLYDSNDDRLKGSMRENSNNIFVDSYRGDLRFATGSSGASSTRMTIKGTAGNVGIGTTVPTAELDIRHDSGLNSAHLELDETGSNDYARIKFINSGNVGSDYWDIAGRANGSISPIVGAINSKLNFFYKEDGNGPGYDYLQISPFRLGSTYWAEFKFRGNLIPHADNTHIIGSSTERWSRVYSVNGVSTTSDIRMKKNITALQYGLPELLKLNPVAYNWKDPNDTSPQIGLIAQEVLDVVPEAVNATEEIIDENSGELKTVEAEIFSMNYDKLIPVLIKSIQEQQSMIDKLTSQNDELNKRLSELEK